MGARRLKERAFELLRRVAARRGYALARGEDVVAKPGPGEYDLVRRSYDSPIPRLEELPVEVWDRRSALAGGIELNPDRAIALIETELAPYVAELHLPSTARARRASSSSATRTTSRLTPSCSTRWCGRASRAACSSLAPATRRC